MADQNIIPFVLICWTLCGREILRRGRCARRVIETVLPMNFLLFGPAVAPNRNRASY
jgi:hypothetical protein